jgi:hypothetical protein
LAQHKIELDVLQVEPSKMCFYSIFGMIHGSIILKGRKQKLAINNKNAYNNFYYNTMVEEV